MIMKNIPTKELVIATAVLIGLAGLALGASALGSWHVVVSPNRTQSNNLYSVAGDSASDIWAVGAAYDSTKGNLTLTEHWDGSSWSIVPSPNPGTATACGAQSYAGSSLYGVSAISATEAWAVGEICPNGFGKTLIEKWD